MDNEMREKSRMMAEQAIVELRELSRYHLSNHILRFIKKLTGRKLPPYDRFNWPSGLLANALIAYYKNNLNLEISLVIKHALIKYYKHFINNRQKFHYLDNVVAGWALIDLHQSTGDERFKALLDQMVNYLKQHAVDEGGSLIYRPDNNMAVDAVSIGMVCPFLCKYGHTYDDESAINLAIKQLLNFSKNGMDSKTGLPYHGYDKKNNVCMGIVGWGRACGWLMMGMVDSLIYIRKEVAEYDGLKQNFRRLVDKVEAYQREDGFYPWQLTAKEGPYDTSASSMILYAIARGLENDILIGIHRSRLLRGREALVNAISEGKLDNCLAECNGFGLYEQRYDIYPWSLGAALLLFSVNLKTVD